MTRRSNHWTLLGSRSRGAVSYDVMSVGARVALVSALSSSPWISARQPRARLRLLAPAAAACGGVETVATL